jgi:hypothetical protein
VDLGALDLEVAGVDVGTLNLEVAGVDVGTLNPEVPELMGADLGVVGVDLWVLDGRDVMASISVVSLL